MIIRILVTITKKVKGKHRWRSLRFAHTQNSVGVACASRILRTQVNRIAIAQPKYSADLDSWGLEGQNESKKCL